MTSAVVASHIRCIRVKASNIYCKSCCNTDSCATRASRLAEATSSLLLEVLRWSDKLRLVAVSVPRVCCCTEVIFEEAVRLRAQSKKWLKYIWCIALIPSACCEAPAFAHPRFCFDDGGCLIAPGQLKSQPVPHRLCVNDTDCTEEEDHF